MVNTEGSLLQIVSKTFFNALFNPMRIMPLPQRGLNTSLSFLVARLHDTWATNLRCASVW